MGNENLRKEYLQHIAERVTPVTWGYYDWLEAQVVSLRGQLAAANADAERLAERLAFQKAWLTWCPDDDKALALHAKRLGGAE